MPCASYQFRHAWSSLFFLIIPGQFVIAQTDVFIPPVEICDNAIDDDGDGLIDLNDPDCHCDIVPTSLIPNPSFEEMNCCPLLQSELSCAVTWIQASEPTTDYLHVCGWMGWDEFPPPLPFPDGMGAIGFRDGRVPEDGAPPQRNWKEYAGACLLRALQKDTTYIFEFYVGFVDRFKSPPINITFFGTHDCSNLPFGVGDPAFGCPTNGPGWLRLGSKTVSGGAGNKWIKTTLSVKPDQDIAAIAIGPDCLPALTDYSLYYFLDDLRLIDLRSYQFTIAGTSNPCADDYILSVPGQPGFSYQWYKNGIALIGEIYASLLMMHGEGDYQVRIEQGNSCTLSAIFHFAIPIVSEQVSVTICDGDTYWFGDTPLDVSGHYLDTFKTIYHCDSIVSLDLQALGQLADTVEAKIFQGETYTINNSAFTNEGDYLVHLASTNGCDSLVLLQLTYYHLYIPNIFSPNGDGFNDVFSVAGRPDEVESSDITVFDRWGNQVYVGPQWDGLRKGKSMNPGVYTYVAKVKMQDGAERIRLGNVTLVE